MKKALTILSLILLASFSNGQMRSQFTNVTTPGGHDGSIDMRVSGGVPPYAYQWNDGVTDEDRKDLKSGKYTVIVTDQGGCEIIASFNITEPQSPGSNSLAGVQSFTSDVDVFPNPADGTVNVHFSGAKTNSISIKVTDISGKVVFEKNYGEFNGQLEEKVDLTNEAKGIYMVQVITERESYNSKIVVQ
ncbi:MAG TPA: hypothetical protein DCQ93_04440 [Bacteroidetes bacterium]|nr:hypothetical protein [Bacteroidota bacterium]